MMNHLRIIIDGRTRFADQYHPDRQAALAEVIEAQWPVLTSLGQRVVIIATDADRVSHIVART